MRENWRSVRLVEVLGEPIRNGYSPVCPNEATGKWILSLGAVTPHGFDSRALKPAPVDDARVATALLRPGDIVVSRSNTRDRVGLAGLYVGEPVDCAYPDLLMRLRVRPTALPEFITYALLSDYGRGYFKQNARGTSGSMLKIDRGILEAFPLRLPPVGEQRKIAAILSAVDDTIEATQAVMDQLQIVKNAMMAELLTRGLPGRHVRFKQTDLGEVPEEWHVRPLGQVAASFIDFRGRTPKKLGLEWGNGTIPALSAMNVQAGRVDLGRPTYYGSEALYRAWMTAGDPMRGDVLLTMEAPLGNVAQVPDDRRYILSQRVVLIKPRRDCVDPDFLAQYMRGGAFQHRLKINSTGTTAKGIQRARLVTLPVAVPPLDEQVRVARILAGVDERITSEGDVLVAKRSLKAALMSALLTGEVRVTPDEVAA